MRPGGGQALQAQGAAGPALPFSWDGGGREMGPLEARQGVGRAGQNGDPLPRFRCPETAEVLRVRTLRRGNDPGLCPGGVRGGIMRALKGRGGRGEVGSRQGCLRLGSHRAAGRPWPGYPTGCEASRSQSRDNPVASGWDDQLFHITEYGGKGQKNKYIQHQRVLHRNLIYLATITDASPRASKTTESSPSGLF